MLNYDVVFGGKLSNNVFGNFGYRRNNNSFDSAESEPGAGYCSRKSGKKNPYANFLCVTILRVINSIDDEQGVWDVH